MECKLSLHDFLECFTAPQIGRLAAGSVLDLGDEANFKEGQLVRFHRKVNANIPLSFNDPWEGNNKGQPVRVSLPVEFEGKFRILPYDPKTDDSSPDHIYTTVEDLIEAFPVYIQANTSYGDSFSNPRASFSSGERFKLTRLVHRDGSRQLECRALEESKLLLLPLDCVGNFTATTDSNDYLLSDLVSMMPRKRRVCVSDDPINRQHRIPGIPANYAGDLFMEQPESFVEASALKDESGMIFGIPTDTEMYIIPDEASHETGLLLNVFAKNHRTTFPIVTRIVDWEEETTILENHFIKPGVELVIHGWTRQTKILARTADAYFAIPLTYQGLFELRQQRFYGVSDLEKAHPGYKIQVEELDPEYPNLNIAVGDILRVKRSDLTLQKNTTKTKENQMKYLKCDKYQLTGTSKVKEVKLPMNATVKFREVLKDAKSMSFHISELVTFINEQEITVELLRRSGDQKIVDRDLPCGVPLVLCDYIEEPAVYASVDLADAPAFHVPLRTMLYVSLVAHLDKSSSPLITRQSPKLSTLDRCVEVLPVELFNAMRQKSKSDEPPSPRIPTSPLSLPSTPRSPASSRSSSPWAAAGLRTFSFPSSDQRSIQDPEEVRSSLSSRERPASVSEYDVRKSASKSGTNLKLNGNVRRHKSSENISRSGKKDYASLSLPRNAHNQHNFTMAASPAQHTHSAIGPTVTTNRNTESVAHANHLVARGNGQVSVVRGPSEISMAHKQVTERMAGASVIYTSHNNDIGGTRLQLKPGTAPPGLSNGSQAGLTNGHVQHVHKRTTNVQQMPVRYTSGQVTNPHMERLHQQPMTKTYEIPQGYTLIPTSQVPIEHTAPPGYVLVPSKQQDAIRVSQIYKPHSTDAVAEMGMNETEDDNRSITFSMSKQFQVLIPDDGNLYHFSTKKMMEFFRQLKVDELAIRFCLKEKVDGKKFSRLSEADMERLSLMHPVIVHFRKRTMKKNSNFML